MKVVGSSAGVGGACIPDVKRMLPFLCRLRKPSGPVVFMAAVEFFSTHVW